MINTDNLSSTESLPSSEASSSHVSNSNVSSCAGSDPQLGSSSGDSRCVAGLDGVPGQGPHMVIVLRVRGHQIDEARFSTYGCPAAVACGQFVTEQVEGKAWEDVRRADINEESIILGVGQMPLGREHCPGLAVRALRHALEQLTDPQ